MSNHSFPDLMKQKRIVYVHGFASSAQSGTVQRLRDTFPNADVAAFDLPIDPFEAINLLKAKCAELQPDLILGTSMGGMYAEQLHGYDRILVNPAFQIADTMRQHDMMGKQTFLNPRADGQQEFYVDKALVKAYREVSEQCFNVQEVQGVQGVQEVQGVQGVQEVQGVQDRDRVWGLFGDKDPLVNTFDLFRQHYPRAIHFHGEHRLDDHAFMHAVVPVVRWIDDLQEHRQRPIVFISYDAMHDSYGHPLSSLAKVVGQLIKNYTVYFLAPCPTNDHASTDRVQTWLEQHVAVPAYDHVVFTNQPELLYGDYFITKAAPADMMGAVILFGSDEFKTWEDIQTYFDRLGGQ